MMAETQTDTTAAETARIRAATAAAAAKLLADLLSSPTLAGPVRVEVSVSVSGEPVYCFEVGAAEGGGTNGRKIPPPAQNGTPRLTPLDRLILAKLTGSPCTMEALSHRCGHDNDRYFQKRVKRLEAAGHVLHDFHGYRVAGQNAER